MSQPPSAQSVAEMRTNSGSSSGHTVRTASTTSSSRRSAVLEAAAVLVGARVRQRREELVQQVAVRGVDLDDAKPGRAGAHARRRESRRRPRGSRRRRARSAPARRRANGIALGATGCQPPSAIASRPPPRHGASVLALRPACASWIPATAPCASTKRAIRAHASACASFQMPVSPGEIRPSAHDRGRLDEHERAPPTARLPEVDEVPVVRHPVVGRSTGTSARRRCGCAA